MNLIVIALVLLFAWIWLMRGAFNSFLHLLCTVAAGAIAFALWEHVATFLINAAGETGITALLGSIAWGAGLAIPFAVSLIALRVVTDLIVKANVKLATQLDYALAAAFGLGSGVITAGILVLTLAGSRLPAQFLGYTPVWYNADRAAGGGSLVKTDSLWLPADTLTAAIYSGLSRNAFASSTPLARMYPNLPRELYASRITAEKGRNALKRDDFSIVRRYTVGANTPANDLLADIRDSGAQRYTAIDGSSPASGRLEGVVIDFKAGAKERAEKGAGPVVVSNGQIRLLTEAADGSTQTVFPLAVISQARGDQQVFGRWRFDAENLFVASVGGASSAQMAFEFFVPEGQTPVAVYVRNDRVMLDGGPKPDEYPTVAARDRLVTDGSILTGSAPRDAGLDASEAVVVGTPTAAPASNALGFVIHTQTARRGFRLDESNRIADGRDLFSTRETGRDAAPAERNLRVDRFSIADGQAMMQLDVSVGTDLALTGPVARLQPADAPLRIYDTNGTAYEAVGYIYEDREGRQIRYTPANPITGTNDMPALSTSRDDQKLKVLFLSTAGVQIDRFSIGDKVIATFDPAITLSRQN